MGDRERKRYPLHVCALMLLSGYRMKKVVPHYFFGSHYVFVKASPLLSAVSFVYYLPVLLAEFVVYRFFPAGAENIVSFLRTTFKRRPVTG